MTRRQVFIAAAAILISVVAIIVGWQMGQRGEGPVAEDESASPQFEPITGEMMAVEIYFPGPGGRLYPETRDIPIREALVGQLGAILEGLVAGPESPDLYPALPPEVTVKWLHLNPAGVFYVDLEFAGEQPLPAWGSRQEMLAVYSIVNTILTAAPEVRAVVLLRDGQQRATFAGHLDTSRPLLANPQLIAQR